MDNREIDQLILQIPQNDSHFHEFYNKTKTIVFAYIMSIIKNYDDSSDILQEVYIKIYLAAQNYQSQKKPLAWIFTIARNECYFFLRKRQLNIEYDDQLSLPQSMNMDTKLILEELFTALNDQERQVIIMHSLWGLKHLEIASLLEIPLSTSLSSYHRGMKKMKEVWRKNQ
ncbi:RNA polymerase sigma factor [Candidatus Stoquefichus massiliensis]|uniref:RNA polymerase sigma factor n=1 Tax=Candidatus Stoquefichus massiliensis TaxID=1470350 RepID=UPI0004B459AF|nr:RNA polymerase sigma factor [Candidatus Stoquefichus massiliensis]